jgi:hypothetical protein
VYKRQDQERRSERSVPASGEASVEAAPEIAVCVSGCLAHLYVEGEREPIPLESLRQRLPGLVAALTAHPGIGFVAARLASGETVALGAEGLRNLDTGHVAGTDPLRGYGDPARWSPELARLARSASSGDLILNGTWFADQRKIVVFEEQTSSHGGLGGPQTDPFLLAPVEWATGAADLRSPEALYAHFRANLPRIPGSEKSH